MAVHVAPRHFAKRQDPVAAASNVAGIENSAVTASTVSPSQTALVFDTAVSSGSSQSAPNLAISTTPVTTITPSSTAAPTSSTSSPSATADTSSPISMSTVVGACVGALIGAIALIILGLWFYRRYSRSLKEHARSRRALGAARNVTGEQGRRRSHLEPWNKLEEGDDKWEGMYQTKEVDTVAPMEKLTMFKKSSPSVRTAYTHKSDEPVTFDAHPFAQYHPNLAEELASTEKLNDLPIARQFLGRVDTGPALSWDGETVRDVSVHSGRGAAMSPTPNMAIPTPAATTSQLHRWESAEVIHYEDSDHSADVQSPFAGEQRKSISNPFFSAHGSDSHPRPRSRSNSTHSRSDTNHSRSNSTATLKRGPPTPKLDKGKGRATESDDDPFADGNLPSFPRPFVTHNTSGSLSSISSNDRALQSLIAALDVSAEEAQERLRVASMQPSFISATSAYTSGGEEEDVTGSFPLPPSIDGGHQYR